MLPTDPIRTAYRGRLINAYTEKAFSLRAFKDFCQKKADNYQNLLACITELIDMIPEEDEQYEPITGDSEIIKQLIFKYTKAGDQYLLLDGGYIALSEYLASIYNTGFMSTVPNSGITTADNNMQLITPGGQVSYTNFEDSIASLKGSLHSCITLVAGCTAMDVENVAERVTLFRDTIGQVFSSAMQDLSGSAQSVLEMVKNSPDSVSFLSSIQNFIGIDKLAEDNTNVTPQNTDVYAFTGASPAGALCFDTAGKAISSVVNIACKVIGGFFKGLWSGIKSLWKKATNAINRLVGDPYDLKVVDDKAPPIIDGFRWQFKESHLPLGDYPLEYIFQYGNDDPDIQASLEMAGQYLVDHLVNDKNEFAIYKTLGTEQAIYFSGYEKGNIIDSGGFLVRNAYRLYFQVQIKPKPLNPVLLDQFIKSLWDIHAEDNTTYGYARHFLVAKEGKKLTDILLALDAMSQAEELYYNEKKPEKELYSAFISGMFASRLIFTLSQRARYNGLKTDEDPLDSLGQIFITGLDTGTTPYEYIYQYFNIPSSVKNNDFLRIASGWNPTSAVFDSSFIYFLKHSDGQGNVKINVDAIDNNLYYEMMQLVIDNQLDQHWYPLDFPFVPYRYATEDFSSSRYQIKTDAENKKAFNDFANGVLLLAIAVVVTCVVGATVLKVVRKLRINREAKLQRLSWKMGEGQKLTRKEQKQYLRCQRKLSMSNKVSSGTLGSAPADNSDDEIIGINNLSLLIQGANN